MKLPLNCSVEYISQFMTKAESNGLHTYLMGFNELTEMLKIETLGGKKISNIFGKMMFIDKNLYEENRFPKSIWGPTMIWSKEMTLIKERVENYTGHEFETCVCIYYPNGNSGVGYHSDFTAYGDTSLIPSISLGEERLFNFKEKETLKEHSVLLENGSLIIMGRHCQERYEHSLPLDPKCKEGRINLTFRKYGFK